MPLSTINHENKENLLSFWDWMETTGRAKVVKFTADALTMRHLLNNDTKASTYDLIKVFSDRIDTFKNVNPNMKEYFIKDSIQEEWTQDSEDLYICYQMFKTKWLLEDIRKNGQQAPVQLCQSGRNYFMHPGSDKKYSTIFLNNQDLNGFYVWYPELDNTPWHWTHPHHTIVRTPEEFLDMFDNHEDPTFKIFNDTVTITCDSATVNHNHIQPLADGMHLSCKKWQKWLTPEKFKLELPTLTYTDAVHRIKMEQEKHQLKSITFVGDNYFYMGRYRWTRKNDIWWPDLYNHFPKNLYDTEHKFDPQRAIYMKQRRANLSMHRGAV